MLASDVKIIFYNRLFCSSKIFYFKHSNMINFKSCAFCLLVFFTLGLDAQQYIIEGYAYETGNRGFLNMVEVNVMDKFSKTKIGTAFSDESGTFSIEIPGPSTYTISATKSTFENVDIEWVVKEEAFKTFPKIEMQRLPGYRFEITLAEKRKYKGATTNAIKGARIEVYNNTTKTSELVLEDYEHPEFEVNLLQGNHYTILVRKDGYLAKRLEAYVNVKGCILCFEGIGEIVPGVSDNLTDDNSTGVLLANVEMDSIFTGKTIEINDIYYELNKWNITSQAEDELVKVITVLKDNPNVKIELGSHTDARGKTDYNMNLSEKRAKSAVTYLRNRGGIAEDRIVYKGYGESIIKNHCSDGVDCTEEEHAINRRTELKILNVEKQEVFKTLAVMKQEEFMDELLLDIYSEGQIKVVGNDTIVSKTSQEDIEEVVKMISDEESTEKEVSKKKKEAVPLFGKKEKTAMDKETAMEVKNEATTVTEIPINNTIANGYKIVIKESAQSLSIDDELYKRHQDLMELYTDDLYHYLIGSFDNDKECYQFHKTVKIMYPNAYVVLMKGGEMIK